MSVDMVVCDVDQLPDERGERDAGDDRQHSAEGLGQPRHRDTGDRRLSTR